MTAGGMPAGEVLALLKGWGDLGVTVWVDGGWGVDALLGRETRAHGDLDIVVRQDDLAAARRVLAARGYRDAWTADRRPENFVMADGAGHRVDFHVVTFRPDGAGQYGPATAYPPYAFEARGRIGGAELRCITARYQVESRQGYPLRERDLADVRALCAAFRLEVPEAHRAGG